MNESGLTRPAAPRLTKCANGNRSLNVVLSHAIKQGLHAQ